MSAAKKPAHTSGEWKAVVKSVGVCMYSIGWGEDCYGGHPVYSEFIEPLKIQMHGKDFDRSHATAKSGPPPSSADARLIAAAPRLYAALWAICEGMEASGGWEGDDELFNLGMAAIREAEAGHGD